MGASNIFLGKFVVSRIFPYNFPFEKALKKDRQPLKG